MYELLEIVNWAVNAWSNKIGSFELVPLSPSSTVI